MAVETQIKVTAIDNASGVLQNIAQGILQGFGQAAFGAIQGAVGALGSFVTEAMDAQNNMADLTATILSTGGAAGITAEAATSLADSLSSVTRFSDDAILKGENMLLTFTNIGKDVFPMATEAMLNLAQKMGTDAAGSAIQLGKALNDPTAGVSALTRVGVTFTDAQKEQIETMQKAGDVAGAQKVILAELEKEFGGLAKAAGQTLAGKMDILGNKIGNIQESIGNAVLPSLMKLGDAFSKALDNPRIQAAIVKFAEGLGSLAENGIGLLLEYLPMALDFIDRLAGSFAALDFGTVVADVQTLANGIYAQLLPSLIAFGDFWTTQGPTIQAIAGVMLQKFAEVAEWFANQVLPFLVLQFNKLGAWFQANGPLISRFGGVVAAVFGGILIAAQTMWVFLKPIIDGMITNFMSLITFIMQVFTGDFAGAFVTMQQIIDNTWLSIQAAFSNLAAWVTGWFGTEWAAVGAQWMAFFDGLYNAIGLWVTNVQKAWFAAWAGIQRAVVTTIAAVMGLITRWLASIITSVVAFASNLFTVWSEAWTALVDGVTAAIDSILAAIAGLIDSILAAFQGTYSAFLSIGTAIVENIKTGLQNAWTGFLAWLTDLIKAAIGSILSTLGIGSTAGESAFKLGAEMMNQLAAGIESGIGMPKAALEMTMPLRLAPSYAGAGRNESNLNSNRGGAQNTNQRNYIYGPVTLKVSDRSSGSELMKIR